MKLDLIVSAREIITLDDERPRATKMGVLNERIVGFDEDLANLDAAEELHFDNAVLVPGFIDAHCHTTWWGLGLTAIQMDQARGLDDLYTRIEREVARLDAAGDPNAWVHGTGFNQKHHDGQFPDIAELDRITGDRPLYLRHTSGHAAITNSATLRLLGAMDEGFENPVGGTIVRDEQGNPTGLVEETAQSLIQEMLLPYSVEEVANALDAATRRFAAEGITSFCEAGIGGGWIGHSPIETAAYVLARNSGRLHARATLMPAIDSLHEITGSESDFHGAGSGQGITLGVPSGFGDDWVHFGHVKAFMDGSLLGATAAVTEDFCNHSHGGEENRGYLLNTPEAFETAVRAVYRAGWPVALHAIGDAAIDLALDLIESCQTDYGMNRAKNRIEHFGISRPDQVSRAAKLGIAVTPQASFTIPLGDQMMRLVGPEREGWLYRAKSLVEAGVVVAGSSDLPVAINNVRVALQSLTDRKTEQGQVMGAAEAVDAATALRMYTIGSAIATGQLANKGTLTIGKLADFVALSGSPLDAGRIDELEIHATYVGGRASYVASA